MFRPHPSARTFLALATCFLLALGAAREAHAYTPGSGTVYTDNFNGALNADWETSNSIFNSAWTQVADGGDKSFYADGRGPSPSSPTKHYARHFVTPVTATTFSIAFEYRAELGTGYFFDLELQQRAPVTKKYRLRVDNAGKMALYRTESGTYVQKSITATAPIPVNQKRWIRMAIESGSGGHPVVRARAWAGGATAEPATWTLEFTDDLDTLVRVHTFELTADGPRDIETWIDDLDAYGNAGSGIASSVTKIYIVEASHLDIGFTDPPDVVEAYAKTHIDQALANLAADPAYRWTIEESWYLDRWWERSTEAERNNLVSWLRTGRLRLAAGYATLHSTTAGKEELSRLLYYASRFAREHDVPLRTLIADDVPGQSFAFPEILARSGIEYYVNGMNTPFGGRVTRPNHGDRPFWWVGPDGSRVLTWHTFDSYAEAFDYGFSWFDTLADMYRKMGKKLPEQEEAGYRYPELMLMRAFDNNFAGWKARDMVNAWNATYATPKFELSTIEDFLDMLVAKYGGNSFPSFSGDWGAAWSNSHAGTPNTEAWVRQAQRDGRMGEALLAIGSTLDGGAIPRGDVDRMFRRMLEVDEHSGAGAWPGYFTQDEMDRNNEIHLGYARDARDLSTQLVAQGLDRTLAQVPSTGDAVAVVNATGRVRDGRARIVLPAPLFGSAFHVVDRTTGSEVLFQRIDATSEIAFHATGLPSYGYKVYDLVPGTPSVTPSGTLSVTGTTLENDFYRVVVDPADGALTSIVEKATGRELVDTASAYRFNRLVSSTKSQSDASQPPTTEAPGAATLAIDASGPVVAAIRVTRTGTPHAETVYRLWRGEDRVEVENVLDRTRMPYVTNLTAWRAYMTGMPFDVKNFSLRTETTTRFLDPFNDGFLRADVPDWHNTEHVMRFWDARGGIDYAVDAADAHHFETLSTLTSQAWSRGTAFVLTRLCDKEDEFEAEGGTFLPFVAEPGASTTYRFAFSFRGTPASFDPVAVSRFGWDALEAPKTRLLSARAGDLPGASASFFAVDAPNVLLYTVKNAEIGGAITLRLQELTGAPTVARVTSGLFALSSPQRTQHDEEGGTPLSMDGDGVLVPLGAYETATIRVEAAAPEAAIALGVSKGTTPGTVHLQWTGGRAPFTLERALDPQFTQGVVKLVDEQSVSSFDDPVLNDGATYFYRVR